VISINSNYCPIDNFWLLINSTDPSNQLDWLAKTLQNSENIGEKVHILGHINPSACLGSWAENYYRIINRYESTITGQFFGHTHNDEFEVFYDLQNSTRAVGVAFISASSTTFSFRNPGYRILEFDGLYNESSWQLLDHRNFYMNLTETNLLKKPAWREEYTAKVIFFISTYFHICKIRFITVSILRLHLI
jgi:sphingomyelin phosphodiesterase